ncbi:leucine-rich repeat-containing G-protein coupled receptor 6 [Trichomycterus rosablanca]|uniref:leucine-rich repeat-containing G-protein coupled receptor 6 n=1 Tax=Trichomycterus rosablanca TaxID=2290929 RepID=UPI002F35A847
MLRPLLLACLAWSVGAGASACPLACSCEQEGMLLITDCSELALWAVPSDLHPLTSYLDLSMNNISEIPPNSFHNLPYLTELRLSGNQLRHISGSAFNGLTALKVLMLQNNQLEKLDSEDPWELPNLLSLRLDANLIAEVPAQTFSGMRSLRHLWLDDNALTEIPVSALSDLSTLQAMTLALNRITHIPDHAFRNLSNLVVLHLHNNLIQSLGENSFEGLRSLETLELNFNAMQEFPVAIRTLNKLQELGFHNNNIRLIPERAFVGNPLLQTIHFFENPIQFVGRSAFQFLPKLHTLSLNGATEIREFPDLKGTTSLQILTLTRAGLTTLPSDLCQHMSSLRVLELSHNGIENLPSFSRCSSLQEIGLQHNRIRRIDLITFQRLASLRSLDLSWNLMEFIHPDAFSSLQSLLKLDLSENRLVTLPLIGLSSLTHLKLRGNTHLSHPIREENLPNIRVLEMPHAYQCCVFGACGGYRVAPQWEETANTEEEELQKRALGLVPIHTDYDPDLEEFQRAIEESKLQSSVQCSPTPGPFKPCDALFDGWLVRLGMWIISVVALLANVVLVLSIFISPSYLSPIKFIIGSIGAANLLTGLCSCVLALIDALTFGEFATYGARWETGAGCRATGFLSVAASEASILFLALAAVQCSVSVSFGKSPSHGNVRAAAAVCVTLSVVSASLPLLGVGKFGTTPLCAPSPLPDAPPTTLGFMVALIMMNSLCFLLITSTYIKLYWDLMRGHFDSVWDCAMIKHVAWLIFTNCLLYCPVAFLTFSSLLALVPVGQDVMKSVLLLLLPLPACINPLLYVLFNPHFREDAGLILTRVRPARGRALDSFVSVEIEKSSCDSTQALVPSASGSDAPLEGSVPLVPCRLPVPTRQDRKRTRLTSRRRFCTSMDVRNSPGAS